MPPKEYATGVSQHQMMGVVEKVWPDLPHSSPVLVLPYSSSIHHVETQSLLLRAAPSRKMSCGWRMGVPCVRVGKLSHRCDQCF